jgi:hypothetical protein
MIPQAHRNCKEPVVPGSGQIGHFGQKGQNGHSGTKGAKRTSRTKRTFGCMSGYMGISQGKRDDISDISEDFWDKTDISLVTGR